jgi:hypothetical protein
MYLIRTLGGVQTKISDEKHFCEFKVDDLQWRC